MAKLATYYLHGRLPEGELYSFTCWNEARTSCGCHSVYAKDLHANIAALERSGYTVQNLDRKKR